MLRDLGRRAGPVTLPGICVVREGEEEACDPSSVHMLAHGRLGPPYLARVGDGHEDLVSIPQHAHALDRQQLRVSWPYAHPDQPAAHTPASTALRAARTSLRGNSGAAA